MIPNIVVDASIANAKVQRLPEDVRANLRRVLPSIGKRLGAAVEANMAAKLQSHTRLKVSKLMVENPTSLYVKVTLEWTGEARKRLVPLWLEEGTKPHEIVARNAPVLAFFWPKINAMFFGPRVNHPGNKAYKIVEDAFNPMRPAIVAQIERAVRSAPQGRG